jgi:flavin reductase (DIM6/NTAB) family NADH-FMN oxidoreductase RutF
MQIDLSSLSSGNVYHLMTQTVIPRPIAWVLTDDGTGRLNVAPFSYFTAVSSQPPVLLISVGKRPDGTAKDTHRNAAETGRFVVHIAHSGLLDCVNDTAAPYAPDVSEIDALGLATAQEPSWPLPRLIGPRVAYSCAVHRIDTLGTQSLVFGQIEHMWIDDAVATTDARGRLKISASAVDPLSRLGAAEYSSLGPILARRRTTIA